MSFLELLRTSMSWSWWNPLGIHRECREMALPFAGTEEGRFGFHMCVAGSWTSDGDI